ncbi:MAG: FliA/WhiG family RNA polymerase sigma factor [Oscillospiraceae bacterium]|jgi:RNA polymerase sigma factor for flagellar operon FliA|nr:FliA/WhiG family RNA polymerase sigma factor [Oscillospiraceae bacterium]
MNEPAAGKPVLTDDALKKLWLRFKKTGDLEVRNDLILHYSYLVKWIVRRMMPKYSGYNEYDDFLSTGILGLIDAMDRYDPDSGIKFDTFAVPRVRGEILDYMRSQDWASPGLRKKIGAISDAYERLEGERQSAVRDADVAAELNIPEDQVKKALYHAHMFNIVSFEDSLNPDIPAREALADDGQTPESLLMEKEKKALLAEAIEALPERERLIVTLYYHEGLLLKEIARVMDITESRVSQIHSRVLIKLKQSLGTS